MAKNERFKIVYSQGTVDVTQILVDTETGVNYVFRKVIKIHKALYFSSSESILM